jgi:hypothetical protein
MGAAWADTLPQLNTSRSAVSPRAEEPVVLSAGKRLAPMLPVPVPVLRRDGGLEVSGEEATLLAGMSATAIDRRLAPGRATMTRRGRSHTKPSSLLSEVAVKQVGELRRRLILAESFATWVAARGPRETRPPDPAVVAEMTFRSRR